jgi:hypothetical protein
VLDDHHLKDFTGVYGMLSTDTTIQADYSSEALDILPLVPRKHNPRQHDECTSQNLVAEIRVSFYIQADYSSEKMYVG